MLRKMAFAVGLSVLSLLAYLLLAPVAIRPVVWDAPTAPGYVGVHAKNQRLSALQHIPLQGELGPEHIALGPDQMLYASLVGGKIMRLAQDGSQASIWADTRGRVLGFAFDADKYMIAADAMRGLLRISPDGKQITPLLPDLKFANSVVVASSGKIYVTESSQRFAAKDWGGTFLSSVMDILEHSATGRLLEFTPQTGKLRVVLEDLCFANGVALSSDEQAIFVVETGAYRLWKVALQSTAVQSAKRPNQQASIVFENLPGYPDNLLRGTNGKIWLGFAKPRSKDVDMMASYPLLRKMTLRLPQQLWPVPPNYAHVMAFDDNGKVVADLQAPNSEYGETTGALETADKLFLQSLSANSIGWLAKPIPAQ